MPSATSPILAYIALGSNLGDRSGNLREALRRLDETPGVAVGRVSSHYDNPAVGGPPGSPAFRNAVARVHTTLGPHALLGRLLTIEREMGRVRRQRWEPRVIDLDLLLYGDWVLAEAHLTLPHPRMHERRFVLEPLAEIAPDAAHPTLHATAGELLEKLPPEPLSQPAEEPPYVPLARVVGPAGYWDRLNLFDQMCLGFAMLLGATLLVLGAFGMPLGISARFELPPAVGALPAFAGWGIIKGGVVAFRASARLRRGVGPSGTVDGTTGFPLD